MSLLRPVGRSKPVTASRGKPVPKTVPVLLVLLNPVVYLTALLLAVSIIVLAVAIRLRGTLPELVAIPYVSSALLCCFFILPVLTPDNRTPVGVSLAILGLVVAWGISGKRGRRST